MTQIQMTRMTQIMTSSENPVRLKLETCGARTGQRERRNCVAMVGLSQNLILAKTHADNLGRVRNLNLWGQDIRDVSGTPAERQ
jgi:hypothetical protein